MTKLKNNSNKARKRRNKIKSRVMALRTRQREITRPGMIDLSSEQAKQVFLFQVTIARAEYEAGRLDEEELEEIQSSLTGFPTDNVCMYKKQFNEIFKRIKTMSLARECS